MTDERRILLELIDEYPTNRKSLDLTIHAHPAKTAAYPNQVPEKVLGQFREQSCLKLATIDHEIIAQCHGSRLPIPAFMEAAPRIQLAFDSADGLKAAVVTTGGLAPGLNAVVHAIVYRHMRTYHRLMGPNGVVWGYLNGIDGLKSGERIELDSDKTAKWLESGGSELGAGRGAKDALTRAEEVELVLTRLQNSLIDILYVVGGDGSLNFAHQLAIHPQNKRLIVVGIPKTMDNDVLWVSQSFGFESAVQQATNIINSIHCEAESTRRTCFIEFFGASSGFVAANAAFANGHVDLVMIPEAFQGRSKEECLAILHEYREFLFREVQRKVDSKKPHLIIVAAEGVGAVLGKAGVKLHPRIPITKQNFRLEFLKFIEDIPNVGQHFEFQPRYLIRSMPANSHDNVYCQRLGALAVDNALAGYTDFMISQWLTEYVMVPLSLVTRGIKQVDPKDTFWRQAEESTGQPHVE
ncbi:MAG: 6-phosphofructokinase [Fimbriimonas sp.]|nr:6-phosphofructokinase [Fimbriimonas sp.]